MACAALFLVGCATITGAEEKPFHSALASSEAIMATRKLEACWPSSLCPSAHLTSRARHGYAQWSCAFSDVFKLPGSWYHHICCRVVWAQTVKNKALKMVSKQHHLLPPWQIWKSKPQKRPFSCPSKDHLGNVVQTFSAELASPT